MAAFDDRIQALMDEVYHEWNKQENKDKGKRDILNGFSEAHQIAVIFGNFNYQVGNGGIEQWIYNGYFHDDAEKFIDYLEAGAASDARCQVILDITRSTAAPAKMAVTGEAIIVIRIMMMAKKVLSATI